MAWMEDWNSRIVSGRGMIGVTQDEPRDWNSARMTCTSKRLEGRDVICRDRIYLCNTFASPRYNSNTLPSRPGRGNCSALLLLLLSLIPPLDMYMFTNTVLYGDSKGNLSRPGKSNRQENE